MSQKREHRLRKLEKQQQALECEIALQRSEIADLRYSVLHLYRVSTGGQIALPKQPWYKRIFARKKISRTE